jgi:hypothetical protein
MTIKRNASGSDVENKVLVCCVIFWAEPGAVNVKWNMLHTFQRPEKHQVIFTSAHTDYPEKGPVLRFGSLQFLEQGYADPMNLPLVFYLFCNGCDLV